MKTTSPVSLTAQQVARSCDFACTVWLLYSFGFLFIFGCILDETQSRLDIRAIYRTATAQN